MTESDNFLQRWSKRKLAKDEAPRADNETAPAGDESQSAKVSEHQAKLAAENAEPFDLASLPSIESIEANTDVTGFLRPGVPPELSRAALRRAWSADPAIRDFVGLVENGWDFNDPNAMPGFGPITPEEVVRLAGQMLGQVAEAVSPDAEKPARAGHEGGESGVEVTASPEQSATAAESNSADPPHRDVAAQKDSD